MDKKQLYLHREIIYKKALIVVVEQKNPDDFTNWT